MGVSHLLVRFPDGTIKYGSYQNTADVPRPVLYDCLETWQREPTTWEEPEVNKTQPEVEVEVWCDYGGGFYWPAKARGLWLTDTGWREEYDYVLPTTEGEPDWLPDEWRWSR